MGQILMRRVVLCHEKHAAGIAIEAMDDAGTEIACGAGKAGEVMQQGIDQRSRMHAGARVDDHTGGLIDGDDVGIIIEHGEGDRLGRSVQRSGIGGVDVNPVGGADDMRRAGSISVDQHAACTDPILYARPADAGKAAVQGVIEASARILLIHLDSQDVLQYPHCGKRL